MKNIFVALVVLLTMTLTGCNKSLIDLNYRFDTALVYENGVWNEYEIDKWDDYDNDAICIWTKDGKMIYTSMNNVVMYGDN